MSSTIRVVTACALLILPSVVVAENANKGVEDYVLDRAKIGSLLSWVQVNQELDWSSRNTIAVVMAGQLIVDQYDGRLTLKTQEVCGGVAQAAQSILNP